MLTCLSARKSFAGTGYYDFNGLCQHAYHLILEMKIDSGMELAAQEQKVHPGNLIPSLVENEADFFVMFFSEDPSLYQVRMVQFDRRLRQLESEGDAKSPWYLFSLGAGYFQRALICIKFQENWTAAWEFRKAYFLLRTNAERFPGFAPDHYLLGGMETVIGTLPGAYKWASEIMGMSGTIGGGMKELRNFIQDSSSAGKIFRLEGNLYYAYLDFFIENKHQEVFRFIREHHFDLKENELSVFLVANLSINRQQGEYGLGVMKGFRMDNSYFPIPFLEDEFGTLELDRLQLDSADFYLTRFIRSFRGKFYLRDALLKLSRSEYLNGDLVLANQFRALIRVRGNAETDADKAALRESRARWPNILLLKARLLCDGGYFQRATDLLKNVQVTDFSLQGDKLEYAYRMARLYDLEGKSSLAIPFYSATVRMGSDRPEYFAARSALELGEIYERAGKSTLALSFYRQVLEMNEQEYKNSLDQRARAGINRVIGK